MAALRLIFVHLVIAALVAIGFGFVSILAALLRRFREKRQWPDE